MLIGNLDTVKFDTLSNNQQKGKPPRPASLSLPLTANINSGGSGSNSNRGHSQRMQTSVNNIINFSGTSARSGGKSFGASPVSTGRVTPTLSQRKAYMDYQADIDMVRQLY